MDGDWDARGYVVLRDAAPADALGGYAPELDAARDRLLVRAPGEEHPSLAGHATGAAGAIDPYALSPAARELLLAAPLRSWLTDTLGAAPLLIDATETAAGAPDDAPYRDATYVGLQDDAPLAGAAVALGETTVACFPGSHRLATPRFSGRHRHFNVDRDGAAALDEHRAALAGALRDAGLEAETLRLQSGDALVWHGDLVHGPAEGRALVAHHCPVSAAPVWFAYRADRAVRVPHGDAWYASAHYDLRSEPGAVSGAVGPHESPAPPAAPRPHAEDAPPPDTAAVEAEMQREPGGALPRRSGGLMSAVRGLMGRRPPR